MMEVRHFHQVLKLCHSKSFCVNEVFPLLQVYIHLLPLEAQQPYDLIAGTKGHIVDYEKMTAAIDSGMFDKSPDLSQYNVAYGIYPYVSVEKTDAGVRFCLYVTSSGMYQEVLGYYISPESAKDFMKIQLTAEE